MYGLDNLWIRSVWYGIAIAALLFLLLAFLFFRRSLLPPLVIAGTVEVGAGFILSYLQERKCQRIIKENG